MNREQARTTVTPRMEPVGQLTIEYHRFFSRCAHALTKAVSSGEVRLVLIRMNDQTLSNYDRWWIAWKP